jgi:hypothetical protein
VPSATAFSKFISKPTHSSTPPIPANTPIIYVTTCLLPSNPAVHSPIDLSGLRFASSFLKLWRR